jgi:hypothetical protein
MRIPPAHGVCLLRAKSRRIRIALALGLVAFAHSGCVSLTAVKSFSTVSAETASYRTIVDDYADSTRRYALYRGAEASPELQANIEQAQRNRDALLLLQSTLCDYMAALGALADDRGGELSGAGNRLVGSLHATQLVGADDVEAANALATILLRIYAGDRQQRALERVIGEANAPLQRVASALGKFVETEYPAQLDREAGAMRQMLDENIIQNGHLAPAVEPVKGLARLMYDERSRAVASRRAEAAPYAQVLRTIAAGHQALYDSRDHLNYRNVSDRLRTYTADLKTLGKAVHR